jgi:hypothetical protein
VLCNPISGEHLDVGFYRIFIFKQPPHDSDLSGGISEYLSSISLILCRNYWRGRDKLRHRGSGFGSEGSGRNSDKPR